METKTKKTKTTTKVAATRPSVKADTKKAAKSATSTRKLSAKQAEKPTSDIKAQVYDALGKDAGSIILPSRIFGVRWNGDLVQQVAVSMEANARKPWAHAKDRAEVSGGGKKPWKQKGTGRARHGSSRSPLWVGGGVTHGPKNLRDFSKQINKKMKTKALFSALSKKISEGQVIFIDSIAFKAPKTAEAKKIINAFASVRGVKTLADRKVNAFFVAMPTPTEVVKKSFNNLGNVSVADVKNINVVDVLRYNTVVFINPKEAVAALEAKQS